MIYLFWFKFHWRIALGKWCFKFSPKSKWREMKMNVSIYTVWNSEILFLCKVNLTFICRIFQIFTCRILMYKSPIRFSVNILLFHVRKWFPKAHFNIRDKIYDWTCEPRRKCAPECIILLLLKLSNCIECKRNSHWRYEGHLNFAVQQSYFTRRRESLLNYAKYSTRHTNCLFWNRIGLKVSTVPKKHIPRYASCHICSEKICNLAHEFKLFLTFDKEL